MKDWKDHKKKCKSVVQKILQEKEEEKLEIQQLIAGEALIEACGDGNMKAVRCLVLEKKADVNFEGSPEGGRVLLVHSTWLVKLVILML